MRSMMRFLSGVVTLGLLVSPAGAANTRSQALGGEQLLINDRTTEISLNNLGNPAGLVLTTPENFIGLEFQTKTVTETETMTQAPDGSLLNETQTTDTSFLLTPDQGLEHALLFWLNPDNVLSVTAGYQGLGHQTAIKQPTPVPTQDTTDKNTMIQVQYAVRFAPPVQFGVQLGYRSGQRTLADITFEPEPGQSVSYQNSQVTYDLFQYCFGLSLDLPWEGLGQFQAGATFKNFDRDPFQLDLTHLLTSQAEFSQMVENILLSGFEYDLAGGYRVKQQYQVTNDAGPMSGVSAVTNEITPQGSIVGVQTKLTFLENQVLGLNLELPFAELTTNKTIVQTGGPSDLSLREDGKSSSVAGLHFKAQYFGQAKMDDPAMKNLLWGARLGLGREDVKQYDYPNKSTAEIGSYQVFPTDFAVAVGVRPESGILYFGEFALADSTVKVDKLTLSGASMFSPASQQTIQDSQVLRRLLSGRVGCEFPLNETVSLRGGYTYNRLANQYDIKDGETVLGPNLDRTKPGTQYNPYSIDNVLSLGAGIKLQGIAFDAFGAYHIMNFDPASSEENGMKTERKQSAWELGAAAKILL